MYLVDGLRPTVRAVPAVTGQINASGAIRLRSYRPCRHCIACARMLTARQQDGLPHQAQAGQVQTLPRGLSEASVPQHALPCAVPVGREPRCSRARHMPADKSIGVNLAM
jgi:hypothetical protein